LSGETKKPPEPWDFAKFKPYDKDAENFVTSNWLRSYRKSPFAKYIDKAIYFDNEIPIVNALLERHDTVMVTAHNMPDQFQAFMNFKVSQEHNTIVLNYIYVKQIYRKSGYATRMLEALLRAKNKKTRLITTYDTKDFVKLKQRWNFIYNPYLVRGIT
jgi:GNAT superfamily N-acetyltransferase